VKFNDDPKGDGVSASLNNTDSKTQQQPRIIGQVTLAFAYFAVAFYLPRQ